MQYNYAGFLKEEDKNIRTSKYLKEMFITGSNDSALRMKIIEYVRNGIFLTGVMSYIYDDEKKPIGNINYFTDGLVIWPIYYTYY